MNISVIGTGYVGLVAGTCFAEKGSSVICVDINEEKINNLKKGIMPIYEPGLSEMVLKNVAESRLNFTTDIRYAVEHSDIIFIAVGTPPDEDGSADLKHVLNVAKNIGQYINGYKVIVDKSTVPVGTADKVKQAVKNELNKRRTNIEFDVVSNPEFLKEGDAIIDFMQPDRVVLGADSGKARELMRELYLTVTEESRIIFMSVKSAEMTKYAANAMLATRISFMNDISNLCEILGADVEDIKRGIGSDSRIGSAFLNPGIGYGGSCFPKDVKALIKTAQIHKYDMLVLKAVEQVNMNQKSVLIDKITQYFTVRNESIKGKCFAIWGLSFKPETDDMREASSIIIINQLLEMGASVVCYDPQALKEAHHIFGDKIQYAEDKYSALDKADALLILTEWKEFKESELGSIEKRLKRRIIFDGRNIFSMEYMMVEDFDYISMGRETIYNYTDMIGEAAVSSTKEE